VRPVSTDFILDSCGAVPAYLRPVTSRLGEAQTVSPTAPFLLRLLGHGGGPVLRHQHRHRFASRSRRLRWDSVSSCFCSARARRHAMSGAASCHATPSRHEQGRTPTGPSSPQVSEPFFFSSRSDIRGRFAPTPHRALLSRREQVRSRQALLLCRFMSPSSPQAGAMQVLDGMPKRERRGNATIF